MSKSKTSKAKIAQLNGAEVLRLRKRARATTRSRETLGISSLPRTPT